MLSAVLTAIIWMASEWMRGCSIHAAAHRPPEHLWIDPSPHDGHRSTKAK